MKAKKKRWQFLLILFLVFLSSLFYYLHYLIFHDPHHIFIYMIGDIAFVPMEVLLVTLVLHKLLEAHQKKAMMKKLNMVIGSFFSEVGTVLLKDLSKFCLNITDITTPLDIATKWDHKDFTAARNALKKHSYKMDAFKLRPNDLKMFLICFHVSPY